MTTPTHKLKRVITPNLEEIAAQYAEFNSPTKLSKLVEDDDIACTSSNINNCSCKSISTLASDVTEHLKTVTTTNERLVEENLRLHIKIEQLVAQKEKDNERIAYLEKDLMARIKDNESSKKDRLLTLKDKEEVIDNLTYNLTLSKEKARSRGLSLKTLTTENDRLFNLNTEYQMKLKVAKNSISKLSAELEEAKNSLSESKLAISISPSLKDKEHIKQECVKCEGNLRRIIVFKKQQDFFNDRMQRIKEALQSDYTDAVAMNIAIKEHMENYNIALTDMRATMNYHLLDDIINDHANMIFTELIGFTADIETRYKNFQ